MARAAFNWTLLTSSQATQFSVDGGPLANGFDCTNPYTVPVGKVLIFSAFLETNFTAAAGFQNLNLTINGRTVARNGSGTRHPITAGAGDVIKAVTLGTTGSGSVPLGLSGFLYDA